MINECFGMLSWAIIIPSNITQVVHVMSSKSVWSRRMKTTLLQPHRDTQKRKFSPWAYSRDLIIEATFLCVSAKQILRHLDLVFQQGVKKLMKKTPVVERARWSNSRIVCHRRRRKRIEEEARETHSIPEREETQKRKGSMEIVCSGRFCWEEGI